MTALVEARGLSKRFPGGVDALDSLSFDLRAGETVALLGPSGCGKSTALRIVAGLDAPSAGAVAWPGGRPELGFVFQDATLMPWARTLENVRLPLDLARAPRAEADARAAAALAQVGLRGFERAYPRELSGGMRMRASLARALVTRPQALLMDEPFAALDEITREKLNDDLLALQAASGAAVLFVTHSVYESVYLANRILVLTPRPGRLAAEIAVEAPAQRSHDWRMSAGFAAQCARVSAALRTAMARPA